ncbi:Dabb family protein [Heliobacillus mobilis]|uniref:Dabb family protein n=1 Tax=Heliobacterium mobile TaxID=28064 RepID=A0A6I3SPL8_HELMO|nr:Dabb family protein [Heliobacterium mobile]MTV50978.1 Dabb family protein [Heliobacterium mobile]
MIVHNLLLKLQDRSSESIEDTRKLLLSMGGRIDVIRDLKVFVDIRHAESSYDISLIAKFDSMDDFQTYLPHPVHVEIGNQLKSKLSAAANVCYEE